jgi:predicted nucleic acid-binding protein
MQRPPRFFDTNIWVYAVTATDPRSTVARAWVQQDGHVNLQVLNEFVNVLRKKLALDWSDIDDCLRLVHRHCQVHALGAEVHELALHLGRRHALQWYDALIVAAALTAGCDELLSEDLQHGQLFEQRLRVRNPFRPD